jgi:drug/metabolite transporter (DMT)-like permease
MATVGPYVAFLALCLIYGSSYAWISTFIERTPPAIFSFLRMFFALIAILCIHAYYYQSVPESGDRVITSLADGSVSRIWCFFGRIIGLGIPTSIITLAQWSVPSVIVTLSQPTILLFSLVLAHFLAESERSRSTKFSSTCCVYRRQPDDHPLAAVRVGELSFRVIGFVFLFIKLFFYGLGSIYIKLCMTKGEVALVCSYSVTGGTAYNPLALLWAGGFGGIFGISFVTMANIALFSIFFSALPSFLFIYVVQDIGPVKANLVDFGQIIIGVFCGVFLLNEWRELTTSDKILSWIGVGQIFLSLSFDFNKHWKEMKLDEPPVTDHKNPLDENK